MNKFSSTFGQVLQIFSKKEFSSAVKETKSERGAQGFSSWDQFVAMLFCQLGQAHSLREIWGPCKLYGEAHAFRHRNYPCSFHPLLCQ